jgi:hypothetical protein
VEGYRSNVQTDAADMEGVMTKLRSGIYLYAS